MTSALH